MSKFDFSIYKGSKQFFYLFDVYIKYTNNSKKDLYHRLNINNSSYRRARDMEQKVGKEIIKTLSDFFELVVPTNEQIEELEIVANRIYNNMYYKIYNTYDSDMEYINNMLETKSLLFPILNLLKIFFICNSTSSAREVFNQNKDLYFKTKIYTEFFSPELNNLLEILKLFFDDFTLNNEWPHEYDNAMSYQILASKYYVDDQYIQSIFYSTKANELLLKDCNFKRYITNNRTLMNSLLCAGNYDLCYELAKKQLYSVNSLDYSNYEKSIIEDFICIAMLGQRKYQTLIDNLINCQFLTLNKISCLLLSLYIMDKREFYSYIDKNIKYDQMDEEQEIFIKKIIDYLINKDKDILDNLNKKQCLKALFIILRKK